MLKDIKSSYFNIILFSYIKEGPKLKLIKYNKNLQKNMNISIMNYKYFKGTYIIYEPNGIGKEYDGRNDILMFEGRFLNGKRNGKGKEYNYYYLDVIDFEGEYLNGKRNGKGKEYDDNKLIFEGEYLNDLRNGKGKEYYEYTEYLCFEGEYLNNKRWKGTI